MSKNYVVWGSSRSSYKLKKSATHKTKDAFRADSEISYCVKCKCCWEKTVLYSAYSGNKDTVNYYNDFVAYGKQRKTCPRCQLKNKKVS